MEQEDLIERDLTLTVLLPAGHERTVTVHGSKPVMDVLVILCARYHLNPSDHVIELFSTNHNKLKFKPSSLIGSLEAELIVLKPKGSDNRKAPNMPVATVRLLINYRKSHKAVVRVSPRVPLAELMPAVCDKCEMDPKTTVLLRDSQSEEPLDLTKTLNDYGIRDLYAKAVSSSPTDQATLTHTHKDCKKDKLAMQEKVLEEKENRGLLSLFRRSKKSAEETASNTNTISTATSLVLKDEHANKKGCSKANSATSMASSEMPKKRRAPQPPSMLGSQSVSCELNSSQQATLPSTDNEKQGVLSRVSSTESSLKRNKRRAPPPPCTSPSPPDSSDKERSYRGSFLEDAEEDNSTEASFNQSSNFKSTCLSGPSSPLMTEVLSEFIDRMKTMEQEDVSFDWSVTYSPPAPNRPPVSGSLDGDPVVPPGCELLRHGSQRDGLTTFTVVPIRRPQCKRQYEVLLTMETLETINGDTGGNLEESSSESRELEKIEMSTKEIVMLERTDAEFENELELQETNKELGITEAYGKLNLNIDAEKHLPEDRDRMEDQDGRDWIELYRERRRRFLSNDDDDHDGKEAKVKSDEEMVDDVPPSPPQLPVCWEEEDTETQNLEETESFGKEEAEEDKTADTFTIQNPNPSRYDPQHNPTSNPVYTRDPYRDVNLSSNRHSSNSDTPFTSSSQSNPHNHQHNSVQSMLPHVSKSKLDPSFELSSPNSASLFALAVSRRVQSLGNGVCPLIPSARRISSPTPHPQSVGSQHTSSQKLYFQNLISQEFISKIPVSLGPCDEAPPISTAPPSVMTTRARRQAWSSFSRTKLKNLEQV
ncbi:hypothetical protein PGIGA_G00114550 [Pangasianodon gigas]|uniref:Uncharacterized protein n=1 Tax=Pangasianodon gigas TaxID=30993 RepID=A0ACC5W9U1_PANGG|nr:hypothetical protein [Pangasianodon gigas]